MEIKNCPKEAYDYEFIVITNDLEFVACTTNGFEADALAQGIHGFVVHNVRIQGKKPKEKWYEFTGTWSWGCYATSIKEAESKLKEDVYAEDLDIDFDNYTWEVIDENNRSDSNKNF